jgi:hypothetical protein
MLVMETSAKIRRPYFVPKKAIKEICRVLKISRKTVRRVVRRGATATTRVRRSTETTLAIVRRPSLWQTA